MFDFVLYWQTKNFNWNTCTTSSWMCMLL